jgi:hypothetical protein
MVFDPKIPYNDLPDLPPSLNGEAREKILNHLVPASRNLAELNVYSGDTDPPFRPY